MSRLENSFTGLQRSRRNLLRGTVILASAILAKTTAAAADRFHEEEDRHQHGDRDRDGGHGRDVHWDRDRGRGGDVHCFLKGTMIRTANGDREIEHLAAGDLLPTVFGGTCPIQWIARSRFKRSDPAKPWVRDVAPIRVTRSALAPDVPHADLYLTQWHALLIDGVLVEAGNLVNGTTITRSDAWEIDELEYLNIKLASHDVIYAEGAPCETLIEVDESAANFAEYLRQYGPPKTEQARCAPAFGYGGRRAEIKSCLRSALSPWIDRRQQVDFIRDKLDARGLELLRQRELISGDMG